MLEKLTAKQWLELVAAYCWSSASCSGCPFSIYLKDDDYCSLCDTGPDNWDLEKIAEATEAIFDD